jgi:hypothetical protein
VKNRRRNFAAVLASITLLAVGAAPVFATDTPAPEFVHPGKIEQCEQTNPHNNPAFADLPEDIQQQLHETWHADCEDG